MRSLPKNNSHFAESSEASKANQEIINTKSASNFVRFEYNKLGVQEQSTDNNLKEYIATKVAALGADSTPHPARQFRYIIGKPAAGYYSKMNNSADSLQNYINTLITRCHNNNTENNSNKFLPLNDRLATLEQQLTSYQQSLNSEKNRNKLISQALEVLTIYTDLLQFIDENISLSQPQISQEDLNYIQQLGMLLCNIGTHKFIRHDSLFGGKSQEFVKFNQQALKQFYQQTQIVIKPFEVQQKVQQEQIEKYQQQIEQTIEEIHDDANNSFALTIQKNQQAQQNLLELEQMLNSLSLNELLATILRELNKTDKPTQHELAPASTALAPLKDALLEFDQLQYQLKMYEIKADQNLQQQLTQFSESNLKLRQLAEEQIKNNPDSQLGILLTKLCDQLQNYSYFDLYKQFLARKLKPQIISSEQTQLISSDDFLEYFLQFEIANQLELLKNQESYLAISQQHKYIQDLAQQLSLAALKEQAQAFLEQLSSLKQQSNQLSQLITQLIKQPDEINNIQKINQAYNNLCQTIIEFNLNLQKANLINLLTPQTLAIMANLENQSTYFATTIHHIYNNTLLALYLTAGKHYQEQLNYLLKATPDKLMPSRLKGINPEAMNNLLDNLDQIELNTTSEVSIAAEKAIFQTQLAIKYIYQSDPKLNNGLEKVYNCLNYALHLQSVLSGISKTNDDFLNLTYLSSTYEHNCLKFMHLYAVLNVSYRSLSRYVQTSQQQLQNLFADLQQYIANDKIYASYTQQLQMIYQSIMHKFNELTQKY